MNKLNFSKTFLITGHITFLLLISLSVIYYKERILFFDNVFYLFKIINFEKFNTEAGRYGAFLSQIPVLAALKAGMSLKSLLLIYSISFILIYYVVFMLCTHVLKNVVAGFSIVFVLVLCMQQGFYHPTHESHQALIYSLLFYSTINYSFNKKYYLLKYSIGGLLIALCFFTYPTVLFPLLYIIAFYIIDQHKWRETGIYILVMILIMLSVFKVTYTDQSSYEGQFLSGLFNLRPGIHDFTGYYSTMFFSRRIGGLYFWLCIIFILAILLQLANKKYLNAGFTFLGTTSFLVLVLYTYRMGDSDVMMERSFLPLTVFVSVPFFTELLSSKRRSVLIPGVLVILVICFAGIRRLNLEGQRFRRRLKNIEQLIECTHNMDGRKFLLKKSDENISNIIMPWTSSFNSIIVSSMNGNQNTRTIFLYDDLKNWEIYLHDKPDVFLGADFWLEWQINMLNHKYFNLPVEPYKVLE